MTPCQCSDSRRPDGFQDHVATPFPGHKRPSNPSRIRRFRADFRRTRLTSGKNFFRRRRRFRAPSNPRRTIAIPLFPLHRGVPVRACPGSSGIPRNFCLPTRNGSRMWFPREWVIHDFGTCRWFRAKPAVFAADTCAAVAPVTDGQMGGHVGDISPIRPERLGFTFSPDNETFTGCCHRNRNRALRG